MRPYKVVLLINLALGIGFLFGYHWWGQEPARLRRELEAARRATRPVPGGERWSVRGIVRVVEPYDGIRLDIRAIHATARDGRTVPVLPGSGAVATRFAP